MATMVVILIAVADFFMAVFTACLVWLELRRSSPALKLIDAKILTWEHNNVLYLHFNLWLSNPGDNPIYLRSLMIESWEYKQLLAENQKKLRTVIPPREHSVVEISIPLTRFENQIIKTAQVKYSLLYLSGFRTRRLRSEKEAPLVKLPP